MPPPPKLPDKPNPRNRSQDYLKYSGMAIQMGVIILLGVWGGRWLDARWHTEPYLTVLLALASIAAAMYVSLKDLFKPNDHN